ncbi:MAG TPA: hypothetical protein PKA60_00700 [Candidatus Paceibacterota bacterium]|nr:hypothetical protein [Candidatus Paceibacterota bacterium]
MKTPAHADRIWYIECLSDKTYEFVVNNIESCTDETALCKDATVSTFVNRKSVVVKKDLIRIDASGIEKLNDHKRRLQLNYRLYIQESRGAKITPWILEHRTHDW